MKPPPSQSLKDKLADLSKSAAKSGGRMSSLGSDLGHRVRALQEAAPGKAADLRARVKASLEKIAAEPGQIGVSLGAKVEALLKPRPLPDGVTPVEPEPRTGRAKKSPKTAEPPAGDISIAATAAPVVVERPSLAERTRTFGRVGLTAVHARLGAVAKVKNRQSARQASVVQPLAKSVDEAKPKILRIDAALPKLTQAVPAADSSQSVGFNAGPTIAPDMPRQPPAGERTIRARRRKEVGRRSLALGFGTVLTAAVTAGVIHIVTIFAIPMLGTGSAYEHLRWQLTPNKMQQMAVDPTNAAIKMPPFLSPDMRYAICRYDIVSGPVAVSAVLLDVGWSLALYTPQGDNFYATPGQDGRPVAVEFLLVPASDRLINLTPGVRRADVNATQVTSPQREGLIVIRAPNKGAAFQVSTQAALNKATCAAVVRR
jgi:uncharacterized membrane protein